MRADKSISPDRPDRGKEAKGLRQRKGARRAAKPYRSGGMVDKRRKSFIKYITLYTI